MKHARTMDKEVRTELTRERFILVNDRKHLKYRHPRTGKTVTISSSPSCPYASRNQLRDIRKAAQ